MRLPELGHEIRKARLARQLTQAQLAAAVKISRPTLNLLEAGLVRDLGVRKVLRVLERLGLELTLNPTARARRPNYVRMACTTASVSLRSMLTEDELIHALVTGKVPVRREAHFRILFDEAPAALLKGLVAEATRWTRPGRLERNLRRLANDAGASRGIDEWLTTG
jgi:transcriptional regulator with XRE-family HTH domain